jgi:hypothetical protein
MPVQSLTRQLATLGLYDGQCLVEVGLNALHLDGILLRSIPEQFILSSIICIYVFIRNVPTRYSVTKY